MKTLEKLINEQTYMVVDNQSIRFNFIGLITLTEDDFRDAVNTAENIVRRDLIEDLPEDVQKAVFVMAENNVALNDFTWIVTLDYDDDTYYLLAC